MSSRKRTLLVAGVVAVLLAAVAVLALTRGGAEPGREQAGGSEADDIRRAVPQPREGAGGVRAVLAARGFKQPVAAVTPPAATAPLFVVERGGRVWRLTGGQKGSTPFLDLSREVSTQSVEQGLLGLAFAPDFRRSRRFYVYFSDRRGDIRLQEFRAPPSARKVDLGTRRQVLFQRHPSTRVRNAPLRSRVHYGGHLEFGPDGMLYVSMGDGGPELRPSARGQSLRTLLGKIIRIDPRPAGGRPYTVPGDNPFVDRDGARGEIFVYGLRNPFRFSFDRPTGDLWIGDVARTGQEEIDYRPGGRAAGANFGWPCFEGTRRIGRCRAPGHVRPAIARPRIRGAGCSSIIGGYVVRDRALRSLRDRYLYIDFCESKLRAARVSRGRVVDEGPLGLVVPWTSSFGRDGRGRIYMTGFQNGRVYRLAPAT